MNALLIPRFATVQGSVRLPGSKSIANRVLLLSALTRQRTRIQNLPLADDILVLLRNLLDLGFPIEDDQARHLDFNQVLQAVTRRQDLWLKGDPDRFDCQRPITLQLDNAGTALRPLVAVLATRRGSYIIDGNEQMRRRPIQDLVTALQRLGCQIEATAGCPPVRLEARGLKGGKIEMSGQVSSQFISAMLMAAPFMQEGLTIRLPADPVSKPYIDLSISLLRQFDAAVKRDGWRSFQVQAAPLRAPECITVEGDATAATYFLAAGALPGSGPVRIEGLGSASIQGDIAFCDLLQRMGAAVNLEAGSITIEGPPAGTRLRALDVDMNAMPDAAMTLAVLALFADGESHIRNIANLRVKESERIQGLRIELEKLGARVIEEPDALHISPPMTLRPASIETYKDHRMAMAFALAAYGTDVTILDPGCVSKTYTAFFDDFLPLCRS
ncbi:MAG: 3-phosphoshikimate 1-carboxyvinyltransferase [Leptospiraceae bacterium]|nr:3-phosphoshikimate 1-carboxyvinyltransferase [Leptospiraceae bacterium]